jgi:hypothetical protein
MSEIDSTTPDDDSRPSAADSCAMAIGYVCIEWGLLEGTFDRFMRQLFGWSHRDETTHILNMNIRQSEKITIIRAVGTAQSPSLDWLERLTRTLTTIDNDIRPLRNRFVHDMWLISQHEPLLRRTRTTKISRPQARQIEVSAFSDRSTQVSEILDLVTKIREASEELNRLADDYGAFRHQN